MDLKYLSKHIQCSNEDKIKCMEMVNKILALTNISRSKGLLALENEITNKNNPELLQIAISLVVDGIPPEKINEILENYIVVGKFSGQKFLENIIIKEGILSIQSGNPPKYIQELLCSYFGLDFRKTFSEHCKNEHKKSLKELLLAYENIVKLTEKTDLLNFCKSFDNRSIQRILRELDNAVFTTALFGTELEIGQLFLQNISSRLLNLIVEDMPNLKPTKKQIIAAQKTIVDIITKLEQQKEIIRSDDSNK